VPLARPRRSEVPVLPHVWRVSEGLAPEKTISSGHAPLDPCLPGNGWPSGCLVEVLQERAGQHVWQLLLPALVSRLRQSAGPVVLVNPPFEPFGPALKARGLPGERLLCVHADRAAAQLWATEQALRCGEVAAVLAWLPRARSAELRRLHMAVQQHQGLLFAFRGVDACRDASPARLRLLAGGTRSLELHILKRRGPQLEAPVVLQAHPARLCALLEARQRAGAPVLPLPGASTHGRSHVLDRTAALS